MQNDAIHDVLYVLHTAHPIADDALTNDFERRCSRIAVLLRGALSLCFLSMLTAAAWPFLPWAAPAHPVRRMDGLLEVMIVTGSLSGLFDILPLVRSLALRRVHLPGTAAGGDP